MNHNTYLFTGTTGIGKTKAAISLAQDLLNKGGNLLILSIDSRKAYKKLNIGTNKFAFLKHLKKLEQLAQDKNTNLLYCGIDLFEPHEQINVFEFYKRLITQCQNSTNFSLLTQNRFKTIVFGGTLLYIKPILNLPVFDNPGQVPYLRSILDTLHIQQIQTLAQNAEINLKDLNKSEQYNKHRLIRKIEVQILRKPYYFETFTQKLTNLNMNFNIQKLKQAFQNAIKQFNQDKKDLHKIQDLIKLITSQPLKTQVFIPDNILDKTYITKLVKRIFTMFELGFAKEVATLMQEYSQKDSKSSQTIPAFSIMGYDILYNLLKNSKNPQQFAKNIDQYYSSLIKMQLNTQTIPEFIADYYIQNHNLGLEKIAEKLDLLAANRINVNNATNSNLSFSLSPLLQIFKKHLDYARYQKQSIKSILDLR